MRLYFLAGLSLASCSLFRSASPDDTAAAIRESATVTREACAAFRASGARVPPDVERVCDTFAAVRCVESDGGSAGSVDEGGAGAAERVAQD
jgi:hypothetical protein